MGNIVNAPRVRAIRHLRPFNASLPLQYERCVSRDLNRVLKRARILCGDRTLFLAEVRKYEPGNEAGENRASCHPHQSAGKRLIPHGSYPVCRRR